MNPQSTEGKTSRVRLLVTASIVVAILSICGCGGGGGGGNGGGGGSSPQNQLIIPGLIALYSFDDLMGNRTFDSSGRNFHGDITAASRVKGKLGEGLLFGFDNARVKIEGPLTFNKGLITVEVWIKPYKMEGGAVYRIIGEYSDSGLSFQVRNGRLEVLYQGRSYHYGIGQILPDVWTHIAFSSDGKDIVTYINGISDGKTNITLPVQYINNIVVGASWIYTGGNPMMDYVEEFPGVIDELRIWDTIRASDEIKGNYDKQLVNPHHLSVKAAYWAGLYSFDESSGNIAYDESGLNNDGTITAASRVTGYQGNGLLFGADNARLKVDRIIFFDDGLIYVEAWIKPYKIEGGAVYRIIGEYNNHGLCFQVRDGRLEVLYEGQSYHYGKEPILPDVWTHIAFSSDGRDIITYINGITDEKTNITLPVQSIGAPMVGASEIYIGGNPMVDYVEEFPGIIDQLAIIQGVLE